MRLICPNWTVGTYKKSFFVYKSSQQIIAEKTQPHLVATLPDVAQSAMHDDRLLLRPTEACDIEPLYQAVMESTVEIAPWSAWYHPNYTHEDTAKWINDNPVAWKEDRAYSFSILDKQTNQLLGTIGINQLDRANRRANLGYFVRTSCTNRGTATAATLLLARFGFTHLGLKRIEIVAAVGNFASQRVAMKVGATREGVARQRTHISGKQLDTVMFSLVPRDFGLD
jgi:ribosomal-protein-serine acetyltransferase